LRKFFQWQNKPDVRDYFPSALIEPLVQASLKRDKECLSKFRLGLPQQILGGIARYNAQDHLLQRFYPVPAAQCVKVILDFGAGFGRMANLAFSAPGNTTRLMIAVDAIPGPYLTQRVYYTGLELQWTDYIDCDSEFDFHALPATTQLVHLPTWRFDLVPSASIDLVCCTQVLKELPGEVLIFALKEFARVLKPRGALYIRDHIQHHHPNQMPVD
jgi:SAM-dependent methyltransferase